MKLKSSFIIIIFIIIVVNIILFGSIILKKKTFSIQENTVSYESFTTPKVLNDVKRQEITDDNYSEIKIEDILLNRDEFINEKSQKLLKYILKQSLEECYNVDIMQKDNKKFYRINYNDWQIDLKLDGELIKVNYNSFSSGNNNKKDYSENELLEEVKYKYDTKESIQPVIDRLYEILNLEEYELISCQNQIEGNWSVVWNKKMENGIVNPFDVIVLSIDAKDASIMTFNRNQLIPDCNIEMIDEEKAIECAKPILQKIGNYEKINKELTVVRPNFYWEDGGPYQMADFVRIAWQLSIDNRAYIYIDAETGEILGGDTIQ